MEILEKNLERCNKCKRLRGYVDEKYNGTVPVFCKCDLSNPRTKIRCSFPSPSMISRLNDKLYWTPTTDFKNEDGEWRHVPYFCGIGY